MPQKTTAAKTTTRTKINSWYIFVATAASPNSCVCVCVCVF